ncbi:hypothetical protein [Rhodococcus sp. 1139]|uniref:hypothetical protein n=1 Tax=Rhodococcus sp. 1139 TaxID=1833762 RepID=UPI00114D2765|nr:hypothetical protein [Rhodococcus sp. 1139]
MSESTAVVTARVLAELRIVRRAGFGAELQRVLDKSPTELQTLVDLAVRRGLTPDSLGVEQVVRSAADRCGGVDGDAVKKLLGLADDNRLRPAQTRRQEAADVLGISPDSFRKKPEERLLREIAFIITSGDWDSRSGSSTPHQSEEGFNISHFSNNEEIEKPNLPDSKEEVGTSKEVESAGSNETARLGIIRKLVDLLTHGKLQKISPLVTVIGLVVAFLFWYFPHSNPSADAVNDPSTGGADNYSIITSDPDSSTAQSMENPQVTNPMHLCDKPNPSDVALPDVEICVTHWCQATFRREDGEVDEGQVQIKLRARIINNSNVPLDLSISNSSAMRLLVRSQSLPEGWTPPPLTAGSRDLPVLVNWEGGKYWAIPPNVPGDARPVGDGTDFDGFVTSWDAGIIQPGESYYRKLRYSAPNVPIQEGNLVFQVPMGDELIGLAILEKGDPTKVLGVLPKKEWPEKGVSPGSF